MALTPGTRVGSYEITAALGAGGMGEVYRARDTKLDRDVAIKVLPDVFADDPERLARFQREAKTLAALNHPHIATIHGVEEHTDVVSGLSRTTRALVMELVEGETLAERIAQGPIPIEEALRIARQIAEALQAAHEQGIIHRDLKPANIKVRPDGTVKVLDFSLAKALEASPAGAGALSMSPTITSPAMHTGVGVLLGTAAYMSPEQAKGKPADKRSDIWAFACVLHEMLTGRRAFDGEDITEVIAAIVRGEPDWTALPAEIPRSVLSVMRRCLERDRVKRVGDIAAVLFALDEAFSPAALGAARLGPSEPAVRARAVQRWWRRALPAAAAVAVTALLTGTAAWWVTRAAPPRVVRTAIPTSGVAALAISGSVSDLAITPDGSRIVYSGNNGTQLFVRTLDQLEPVVIATGQVGNVFVSPDGQWVGFGGTTLGMDTVAISGGPPTRIAGVTDGRLRGATWTDDGFIIFATDTAGTGLQRFPAAGGDVTVLTRPDRSRGEADHLWPEMLPDGRGVLFTITPVAGGADAAQIAVLDLTTGAHKVLVRGGTHARYVTSGHLVFAAGSTLRAVAFDLERLEPRGNAVTVLPRLVTTPSGAADFVVAADGTLVYVDAPAGSGVTVRTLVWVDRMGREQPLGAPPRAYMHPRLSPDGTRVALWADDQESDIWMWDLARATLARLTFDPGTDNFPVWTPDGRRLIFCSTRNSAALNLFWQSADGTGTAERLTESATVQLASGVSPDGSWAIFSHTAPTGRRDVVMTSLTGERRAVPLQAGNDSGQGSPREVRPLVQAAFEDRNGVVSPDGRWLAYESDASGRFEVYVRPFPNTADGQWQVSTSGGHQPLWSHSGHELFYFAGDGALMAALVAAGGSAWSGGTPAKILEGRYFTGGSGAVTIGRTYDVAPDGRRFLMLKQGDSSGAQAAAAPQIIVVQNWFEELKRLVPVN